MDTQIICTLLTAMSTIACAFVAAHFSKIDKRSKERDAIAEKRAEQRAKEGKLQLSMLDANCKLTVGVAMALKRGHCNGEVEEGLKAVEETQAEYYRFLDGIAIDSLTNNK